MKRFFKGRFNEVEDKWKIGLEAYYYSPQQLTDGTTGRDYWILES
jgi:iron complex outermembrane receptor protein